VVKKKKVVLVTGAASGLGKCISEYLASRNFIVISTDMNLIALNQVKDDNISIVSLDVTDKNSIKEAYQEVVKTTNGLDALVNNAGIFDQIPMVEGGMDRYERLININVLGAFRVTNTFFPLLYKNKGRIINISSETARTLLPFQSYGSSKYMMEAWSNTLRMELKLIGIHVSLIRAGGHNTPLMDKTIKVLENIPEESIYKHALNKIKEEGGKRVRSVKNDPIDVAHIVLKAIMDESPKRIYSVNESYLYRFLSKLPRSLKEALIHKSLS
jgi:NAD(P)-dependent dehydrogenase (short-subunit alcohol dehydrogenase family)